MRAKKTSSEEEESSHIFLDISLKYDSDERKKTEFIFETSKEIN